MRVEIKLKLSTRNSSIGRRHRRRLAHELAARSGLADYKLISRPSF